MQLNSSLLSHGKDGTCRPLRKLEAFLPTLLLAKTLLYLGNFLLQIVILVCNGGWEKKHPTENQEKFKLAAFRHSDQYPYSMKRSLAFNFC